MHIEQSVKADFLHSPYRVMDVQPWKRRLVLVCVALLCLVIPCCGRPDPRQREALQKLEVSKEVGGSVELNDKEKLLDKKLHQLKLQDMALPEFPPSLHFFKAKSLIEQSPVFRLLQKMPKGVVTLISY